MTSFISNNLGSCTS